MSHPPLQPVFEPIDAASPRPCLQGAQSGRACIDGREMIVLSSNNYLGLASHPKVIAAALAAIERFGVGTTAARGLAGTTPEHESLERELAAFKQCEAALLFNSGYAGN